MDSTLTAWSILDHVERMTTVRIDPSGVVSRFDQSKEINGHRKRKRARISKDPGSNFVIYNVGDDLITFKQVLSSFEAEH